VHVATGREYIGQSHNIKARWAKHRCSLNRGNHHARHLQAAWLKYGSRAFLFEIIDLCSIADLTDSEQRQFDLRKPTFNTAPVAGTALGVKQSESANAKKRGRKASAETKARMSAAQKGKIISAEQRRKIADSLRGQADSYRETEHPARSRPRGCARGARSFHQGLRLGRGAGVSPPASQPRRGRLMNSRRARRVREVRTECLFGLTAADIAEAAGLIRRYQLQLIDERHRQNMKVARTEEAPPSHSAMTLGAFLAALGFEPEKETPEEIGLGLGVEQYRKYAGIN
jgi:group I intron endonuclease